MNTLLYLLDALMTVPYWLWWVGAIPVAALLAALLYYPAKRLLGYQKIGNVWYSRDELSALADTVNRLNRAGRRMVLDHDSACVGGANIIPMDKARPRPRLVS